MKFTAKALIVLAAMVCLVPAAFAQTPFTQDFEAIAQSDGALAADGWLVYGNIFAPDGTYLWGHGPWPAPNNQDPGNWCDVVTGEGGPAQEMQQLVLYSDYGNADHQVGNLIESNLFQEQILPAGASGIRIRLASHYVTNMGDEADVVVAFNEQVLYSRIANGAYKKGTVVLLEDKVYKTEEMAQRNMKTRGVQKGGQKMNMKKMNMKKTK